MKSVEFSFNQKFSRNDARHINAGPRVNEVVLTGEES